MSQVWLDLIRHFLQIEGKNSNVFDDATDVRKRWIKSCYHEGIP